MALRRTVQVAQHATQISVYQALERSRTARRSAPSGERLAKSAGVRPTHSIRCDQSSSYRVLKGAEDGEVERAGEDHQQLIVGERHLLSLCLQERALQEDHHLRANAPRRADVRVRLLDGRLPRAGRHRRLASVSGDLGDPLRLELAELLARRAVPLGIRGRDGARRHVEQEVRRVVVLWQFVLQTLEVRHGARGVSLVHAETALAEEEDLVEGLEDRVPGRIEYRDGPKACPSAPPPCRTAKLSKLSAMPAAVQTISAMVGAVFIMRTAAGG